MHFGALVHLGHRVRCECLSTIVAAPQRRWRETQAVGAISSARKCRNGDGCSQCPGSSKPKCLSICSTTARALVSQPNIATRFRVLFVAIRSRGERRKAAGSLARRGVGGTMPGLVTAGLGGGSHGDSGHRRCGAPVAVPKPELYRSPWRSPVGGANTTVTAADHSSWC